MMADGIVLDGIRGYVPLSTFSVAQRKNSKWPSALARLQFRHAFRIPHSLERNKIFSRGIAPPCPPWEEREFGHALGFRALAMGTTHEQSLDSSPDSGLSSSDFTKDESMAFRRTVFEQEDWTKHRSSDRHSRHILSIASSRVIWSLGPPVLRLTFIAAVVAVFNEAVLLHLFPFWVPILHVPSLPFQLTAPALALLLVFRTNASYGRFDEARKAWGSNVNRSRDFSRQALTWIRLPADSERLERLLRYCVALPFCLKDHLTREETLREDLRGLLDQAELDLLLGYPHKPNYMLQTMSEIVNSCGLSDMQRALLDRNMTQFHDNLGTCERILKTPIPLSYTRLTSRFLVIWHTALPFALWDQCSWVVIPATFFSAGALFCIEEVGVVIEEPLSMLSLESICQTIRKNVEGLVQAHADNIILNNKLSKESSISQVNGVLRQEDSQVVEEAGSPRN
ncbi:unnamed protein product [Calypogeia fissa]